MYRSTSATIEDTKELCHQLDLLSVKYHKVIIVGNFNLHTATHTEVECIQLFALEHNLSQLVIESTCGTSLLDLVFVSSYFIGGKLDTLPKIGNSDHDCQLLTIPGLHKLEVNKNKTYVPVILYEHLSYLISLIDWHAVFSRCSTTDSYVK